MAITVTSNSSPLLVFSKLNILYLLQHLYGRIEIPSSVYNETVLTGIQQGFFDALALKTFISEHKWQIISGIDIPKDLQKAKLDQGEKEAIALALSRKAMLLMDEEKGRDARQMNLTVKGSLGILIEAHAGKLINEAQLRYYFQQISERKDTWINPRLCERLLEKYFNR